MITEDFVSFEVAKLLQEKGFKEPVSGLNKLLCKEGEKPVLKITHQKAMKWLRETYGIFISIKPYDSYYEDKYEFSIYKKQNTVIFEWEVLDIEDSLFDGYENTVEAALKYSLKNLI